MLERGKVVFAESCARCHSSKLPEPGAGRRARRLRGSDYLECWNHYWAWTKTDEFKQKMRADRPGRRLPRRQLPLDRPARPGDAARDQRLQPARDQRDRRQHLGQLLLAVLQGPALGRHDHGARSVHRRAAPVQDAGRRPRLHAAGLAHQPLVDGAVPAEQQRSGSVRVEPLGRGAHGVVRGLDRADALAGEAREGHACSATRCPAGSTAPRRASYLRVPAGYLPEALQPLLGRLNRLLPWAFGEGGIEIGPIPKGTPVNLLANLDLMPDGADLARARRATWGSSCPCCTTCQARLKKLPRGAATRRCAGVRASGAAAARAQQVPGLRRQPRPLLRHRAPSRRSRA